MEFPDKNFKDHGITLYPNPTKDLIAVVSRVTDVTKVVCVDLSPEEAIRLADKLKAEAETIIANRKRFWYVKVDIQGTSFSVPLKDTSLANAETRVIDAINLAIKDLIK